jgi:hypothetical protein
VKPRYTAPKLTHRLRDSGGESIIVLHSF